MKSYHLPHHIIKSRPVVLLALLPLLLLLGMGTSGCTTDTNLPTATTLPIEAAQSNPTADPVAQVSETVLKAAEQPSNTSTPINTPTAFPTLTPLPTATATIMPSLTATMPETVEVVEATTEASSDPLTPTKPPPLPTPSGVYSWTLKVPILMYHYISEPPEDTDKYRRDLSVTPANFEQQMDYLVENGFETVDLFDLSLAIANKRELPEKPVIITLDDGYGDNYENAFPILQKHGLGATFFVVTEFIDEGREGYLSWEMVEQMAAAGMRIEPHSKTHPDLSGQERDYVVYEALGSQETIAAHIGETPRYFCYPGGSYDEQTIEILQELGYWGAVTTDDGQWHGFDDRFEWSRMRMRNTTTLSQFADLVDPAETVSGKPAVDS